MSKLQNVSLRRTVLPCVTCALATVLFCSAERTSYAASFDITITDEGYTPNHISARSDEEVHISIHNKGTRIHNFILPAFYIYTRNLDVNDSTSVGFTPDKTGTFSFYSDAGGTKEPGISGQIEVK